MIKKIGITGPSGSGKSVLSEYLKAAGIISINADELYHSMLVPPSRCLDAIAEAFGNDVLREDGTLDRSELSAKVFSDPSQLKKLNATVLPIVIDEIRNTISRLDDSGVKAVAIDAPTLIESGFYKECDINVAVLAPKDIRIKRIAARDGISQDKASERVSAQHDDIYYTSVCDRVLVNGESLEDFEKQAESLIESIRSIC